MLKNLRAFADSTFAVTALDGSLPKLCGPEASEPDALVSA